MTTARVTWTELGLKKIKSPKSKAFADFMDPVNEGLCLRVSKTGSKTFSVLYRVAGEGEPTAKGRPRRGKQKRITLGRSPRLPLQSAQKRAREVKELADAGVCAMAPPPEPEQVVQEVRNGRHQATAHHGVVGPL